MPDYINSLQDKSILVASTLITANVWRRAVMDVASGLRMVDTRYPLFWAGLKAETVKVMPVPTITVGHVHVNVFGFFNEVINDYLAALMDANGVPRIGLRDALNWNFVNVSR